MSSTKGEIFSSHPTVYMNPKSEVLFYQKMQCTFIGEGAKSKKKCEAIVYCQKMRHEDFNLNKMWTNIKAIGWFDWTYYIMFFGMILLFMNGSRVCGNYNRQKQNDLKEKDFSAEV